MTSKNMSSRQTAKLCRHISSEKILTMFKEDDLSLRNCDSLRCIIVTWETGEAVTVAGAEM